jgi:hypothetical protein
MDTLGIDIKFVVLGWQFDLYPGTRLLPGLGREKLLQP